jgi:biotin transport system substrate-specific component
MQAVRPALTRKIALPQQLVDIVGISAFALLTALGAYVYVPLPFTPVPLTLQTLMVLASAGFLGRKAAASQALYLALGMAGLPLFAGAAGGAGRLLGPTGGYLAGFILASYLAGWALEGKGKSLAFVIFIMALGSLAILAMGSAWLAMLMRLDYARTWNLGFMPFLPGDLIKAGLASMVVWGWRRK